MDSLLHIGGTLVTLFFIGAVLYSLSSALRKRQKQAKRKKDLETKQHVQVKNLHQYDIQPQKGYYRYPLTVEDSLRRYPQTFTALSIALANEQPYSICLIAFAEFEKGVLKNTHYFYVRPPENKITLKGHDDCTWETLSKADEFGEYWEAGMSQYFMNRTLVAHNAPFVIGCIVHALKIYGIEAPCLRFIDTLETARECGTFSSNKLADLCQDMHIDLDEQNLLSAASAAGQFLIKVKEDYPMYLPAIQYVHGTPSADERDASLIAAAEREECTAQELFGSHPVDAGRIQYLLDKQYLEPGEKPNTYYATNAGLDFSESQP